MARTPAERIPRTPLRRRWVPIAALALLGTLAAFYTALPALSGTDLVRGWIDELLDAKTPLRIRFEALRLGYDLKVELHSLSVSVPGEAPFLRAAGARVDALPWNLARGLLGHVELETPTVDADRLTDVVRQLRAQSGTAPAEPGPQLPADSLEFHGGYVQYGAGDRRVSIGPLDLSVDTLRTGDTITLGGRSAVAGGGGEVNWTADLASDLGSVRGQMNLRFDDLARLLGGFTHFDLPEPVAHSSGTSTLRFHGNPREEVAFDLDASADLPQASAPVALRGHADLHVDSLTSSLELTAQPVLTGTTWAAGQASLTGTASYDGQDDGGLRLEDAVLTVRDAHGQTGDLEWKLSQLDLSGSLAASPSAGERAAAKLAAIDLEFHDSDSTRVGQKLELRGPIEAAISSAGEVSADLDLGVPAGELLWDRFYADLSRYRPHLRAKLRKTGSQIDIQTATASAAEIGAAEIHGTYDIASAADTLDIRLDLAGLGALYQVALRDPLQESYPLLGRLEIGGHVGGMVVHQRDADGAQRISGTITLDQAHASATDPPMRVTGLKLDLPLAFGGGTLKSEPRSGLLRIGSLRLGDVATTGLAADFTVGPNRISLSRAVRIPILGGTVSLTSLEATQLASADRQVVLALTIEDLDLGQLSLAMHLPVLSGTIAGAIPRVTVAGGDVGSEGEVHVAVFGGAVQLHDFRIENLLSPVPAIRLDLSFSDISLGMLTQAVEVGHISGVLQGAVHDLVIAGGQPVQLEASVETVEKSGVPQRISITALRQLSTVAGAGDPLTQGLLSFFDEYGYDKMGLRCRLRNDRFILQGVKQADGGDYLVVGTFLPPRVDVISRNEVISFSEMVRRIERAFESGGAETRVE